MRRSDKAHKNGGRAVRKWKGEIERIKCWLTCNAYLLEYSDQQWHDHTDPLKNGKLMLGVRIKRKFCSHQKAETTCNIKGRGYKDTPWALRK